MNSGSHIVFRYVDIIDTFQGKRCGRLNVFSTFRVLRMACSRASLTSTRLSCTPHPPPPPPRLHSAHRGERSRHGRGPARRQGWAMARVWRRILPDGGQTFQVQIARRSEVRRYICTRLMERQRDQTWHQTKWRSTREKVRLKRDKRMPS